MFYVAINMFNSGLLVPPVYLFLKEMSMTVLCTSWQSDFKAIEYKLYTLIIQKILSSFCIYKILESLPISK